MATEIVLMKATVGKRTVDNPHRMYPIRMYGRRFPQRDRVRSLSVPIIRVVNVAVIALAATIQATGLGSGVIVSKTNVLNHEFSTAQAI
jgi:hypothetical protein